MVWDRRNQVPDSAQVGPEEVAAVLAKAVGADLGVLEVGWKSRFHCEERQVEQYRHGRVFWPVTRRMCIRRWAARG